MDTVTHLVTGAALGEFIAGKRLGKRAMVWGALAANAPDLDAIINPFVSGVDSLVLHRGITHSLIVTLIFGPLIGWGLWKTHRQNASAGTWIKLITWGMVSHLFLDTCTVYGTGLLMPFSNYRFSFDNIFVVDPLYTLPLIIGVLALMILRSTHPSRKWWNGFGIAASTLYLLITFWNHGRASNMLEKSMEKNGKVYAGGFAAPTLFNSILWHVVAKDEDGFWSGYYSVFDGDQLPELFYIPRNDSLLFEFTGTEDVKKLAEFSAGYYTITTEDSFPVFNVLRFGMVRGWEVPDKEFALAFRLAPEADNTIVVQEGRVRGMEEGARRSMWRRLLSQD